MVTGCCWFIDGVTLVVVVVVVVIIFRDGNLNVVVWGEWDISVDVFKSKYAQFFDANIGGKWSSLDR